MGRFLVVVFLSLAACVAPGSSRGDSPRGVPAHREESAVHVVSRGETLYSIARSYGLSPEELHTLNPRVDVHRLEVGASLVLPRGKPVVRAVERRRRATR